MYDDEENIPAPVDPFRLLIDPIAVITAIDRADQLAKLERRAYAGLDKPSTKITPLHHQDANPFGGYVSQPKIRLPAAIKPEPEIGPQDSKIFTVDINSLLKDPEGMLRAELARTGIRLSKFKKAFPQPLSLEAIEALKAIPSPDQPVSLKEKFDKVSGYVDRDIARNQIRTAQGCFTSIDQQELVKGLDPQVDKEYLTQIRYISQGQHNNRIKRWAVARALSQYYKTPEEQLPASNEYVSCAGLVEQLAILQGYNKPIIWSDIKKRIPGTEQSLLLQVEKLHKQKPTSSRFKDFQVPKMLADRLLALYPGHKVQFIVAQKEEPLQNPAPEDKIQIASEPVHQPGPTITFKKFNTQLQRGIERTGFGLRHVFALISPAAINGYDYDIYFGLCTNRDSQDELPKSLADGVIAVYKKLALDYKK